MSSPPIGSRTSERASSSLAAVPSRSNAERAVMRRAARGGRLVELAKQIEEIVGNVFAQGFVIYGAQRTTDDIGLVVPAILGGPCGALVIVLRTA